MTAYTQLLATSLRTGLFALSWTMKLLSATMRAASQLLSADFRASHFVQMARLVLQGILPAKAGFGGKKRAGLHGKHDS